MTWVAWLLLSLLSATGSDPAAPAPAPAPAGKTLAHLTVYPAEVHLESGADRQSLVVQALLDDGTTRDVTAEASWSLTDPVVATRHGRELWPAADGETTLVVTWQTGRVEVPVKVTAATTIPPIRFRRDVMPVLMKSGCNTGTCHGSARGQDGFRLSLFGYDPDGDYHRLTRELTGRRLNLALPAESLMVQKAWGRVPHTGGERFPEEHPFSEVLLEWIQSGAPADPAGLPQPVSLELLPRQAVLEGREATQQMTALARYSDGSTRDVTSLAVFLTSNDASARIDPHGLVTSGQRGEAFVMARFATFTEGSQVLVIPADQESTRPDLVGFNYVDTLVHEKLGKLRIVPSGVCRDEVFLRRVCLDVLGLLPTREERTRFLSDQRPDRRAHLVDELLDRPEFAELWVMKWAELLQIRTDVNRQVSYKSMLLYYDWLRDRIASNQPFDQIVRELLSASGGTFTNPPSNYYQVERDTLKTAENAAQVFLGMRIQCAQCHNHPFDRWTQNDYYQFAAFFSQIGRKTAEDPREVVVFNSGGGEVKHPVTDAVMAPKFLGGAVADVAGKDRRRVLAEWLTSPENPYFARNLANVVWAHFFGTGIVEPVDDVRVSNPPSNPALLGELARRFRDSRYDFKQLVRDLCNSRTYQLSTTLNDSNRTDTRNYSHGAIRRVRAEVLYDAIAQLTGTRNKFPGLPLGARAVQIADGNVSNYFLTTFGRAARTSVCACEVKMEPNLSQALHLLNGDTVHQRIRDGGRIPALLEQGQSPRQVIETLYLDCLSRAPTDTEWTALLPHLQGVEDVVPVLEDLFWALLNSKEFLFNH